MGLDTCTGIVTSNQAESSNHETTKLRNLDVHKYTRGMLNIMLTKHEKMQKYAAKLPEGQQVVPRMVGTVEDQAKYLLDKEVTIQVVLLHWWNEQHHLGASAGGGSTLARMCFLLF